MKKKPSAEQYFKRYLKIAPLAVALCRSVEAKNFASVKMNAPILDIGCGFGEFAQVFCDDYIDMGLDNAPLDLLAASKVKKYKNLLLGDARHLPFANESYATVMSVSSLEHITDVDRVFTEAYRILKPGGLFIASMETNEVDKHMFYSQLLKKIGLHWLSDLYMRKFNRMFHRYTLLSQEAWEKQIEKSGFKIQETRNIVTPKIIKLFDIFTLTAWPSQLLRPVIGKRIVYRPQFIVDLLTSLFIKLVDEEQTNGTVLFLIARKP